MPEPYPVELRARVVAAYESGEGSYPIIAARFSIGEGTVRRWVAQRRDEGDVSPRNNPRGRKAKVSGRDVEALIAALPDANAGELAAEYNRTRRGRNRVQVSTIKRALYRHDYVVKKNGGVRSSNSEVTSSKNGLHSSSE
jgi:transposase